MKLPANMGNTDRIIRAIAALVLLALILTQAITGVVATIAIILTVILLVTAAIGTCPLYLPFHFSTRHS